jgi:hypothetical protein
MNERLMENISDERIENGFIVASRLLTSDLSVTARAFIATDREARVPDRIASTPPRLVSQCNFLVQFGRTREGPDQFADAMRDAE